VSENGGGWSQGPRPPQGSRGSQHPRPPQNPRPPQAPRPAQDPRLAQDPRWIQGQGAGFPGQQGRPPEDYLMPLPPEYEPVHHEPRYDDPRPGQERPDDSPWRRTQRLSRPEARAWQPGQPVTARYEEDPRGPGEEFSPREHQEFYPQGRPGDQGQFSGDSDGEYEDEYEGGGRFVPGFGDDDDAEDRGGGRTQPSSGIEGHGDEAGTGVDAGSACGLVPQPRRAVVASAAAGSRFC